MKRQSYNLVPALCVFCLTLTGCSGKTISVSETTVTVTPPVEEKTEHKAADYSGCSQAEKDFISGIKKAVPPGKNAAAQVKPEEGFVIQVTQDQLDMLKDRSEQFSPSARMKRGMETCGAHFVRSDTIQGMSNFDRLWGGKRKPDPFLVSRSAGGVIVAEPYPVNESAAAKIEELLDKAAAKGGDIATCKEMEKIIALDPGMPMLHYLLSGCYQQAGNKKKSIENLEKEVEVNPSHSESLLALADVLLDKKAYEAALDNVILSLYHYPDWELPGKFLDARSKLGCALRKTAFRPEVFVEVTPEGAVLYAGPAGSPWIQTYAQCKAVFRYCPEVRMSFGMKAKPYKISIMEEMACLTLATDAYGEMKKEGNIRDAQGEILAAAVEDGWIMEFALFEIIGKLDPDYMKFLPADLRASVITYIEKFVVTGSGNKKECDLLTD